MKNGVVQQQLDRRLTEAHGRGLCLSPATEAERLALSRRYLAGEIARPFPGVYARSAYWDAMDPLAKALSLARTVSRSHPDWVFCSLRLRWHTVCTSRSRLSTGCMFARRGEHTQETPPTLSGIA